MCVFFMAPLIWVSVGQINAHITSQIPSGTSAFYTSRQERIDVGVERLDATDTM